MKTLGRAKDVFQYALAALIVLVFFALIFTVFRLALPDANKDVGNLVIGALTMKFGDVVAYFFNSSKGSAEKTDIIKQSPAIKDE